jgi:hypothetical protein
LDELFIIDRALQPHEVIGLLSDNRLPDPVIASNP